MFPSQMPFMFLPLNSLQFYLNDHSSVPQPLSLLPVHFFLLQSPLLGDHQAEMDRERLGVFTPICIPPVCFLCML